MFIKQIVSFSKNGRVLAMLLVLAVVAVAGAEPAPAYELGQEEFTSLATQILTYLGYAVVAGLSILVAVVGARRAWGFMRRFL